MMDNLYRVLLIEDNRGDERLIREMFAEAGGKQYQIICAKSLADGLEKVEQNNLDVILLDLSLPDSRGMDTFYKVQEVAFDLPIIILTGLDDESSALEAVEKGAQDYLSKNGVSAKTLERSVQYGIKRKRMEDQVQLLATAMYSASNVVFITDRDGLIEWTNPAFTQITGYTAAEALGVTPSLLRSGVHDNEFYSIMWQTILAGEVWHSEVTNRRKDGSLYVVEQTITPFSGHSRQVTHFVAIQQDITERKQAETSERSYRREMEALLTVAGSLRRAESSKEALSTMLDETLAALNLTAGYISLYEAGTGKLQRAVTRGWFEHVDDRPMHPGEGISGHVYSTGKIFISEELKRVDLVPADVREQVPPGWGGVCIPIRSQQEIVGILFVSCQLPRQLNSQEVKLLESMTEIAGSTLHRLNLYEETRRNADLLAERVDQRTRELSHTNIELARALRVKDEFLANMSHELRTPLNAILGLSESLAEEIAGDLNQKQKRYIATISESGSHLLSLINDILDLAKIEAGHIKLASSDVDVSAVCQASLRMIKQIAQKKSIQVSSEIDPKITVVRADERRLKQILVNLLGNAVKFTPENGKVGLEVRSDGRSGGMVFTVWDTGIGISKDDQALLFKPFVQLNSSLEKETSGTGLGLALVAQLTRLHGGSISLTSEPGKGSRFSIVLPWAPPAENNNGEIKKHTGQLTLSDKKSNNKPTILLVDDVEEVTMLIRDYLEFKGFHVIVANDGAQGIMRARSIKPDLILMDVQMPGMNGIEATKILRKEPGFQQTPIIAVTALAMVNDRERCLEAGMNEYISKPISLKRLIKVIQTQLDGKFEFVPVEAGIQRAAPKPYRVLVVDDEINILKSLSRSLRDKFEVVTAISGPEALEIVRQGEVSLILTDQRMPEMTGLELLQHAREIAPRTPGILLSGYSDSAALADTLKLDNVRGFIAKPWEQDHLIRQLETAVTGA